MQQSPKKKHLNVMDIVKIQPLTARQEDAFHCFYNYDVVSLLGSAGTGKSFLACYLALNAVAHKDFKQMMIVRTAVPSREIGYLPGTLEEKEEVYERPYHSIFDQLLNFKSRNYENMKGIGVVKFESTSFMRGETYDNTVIIFDEVQNATFQELDTVMTRVGEGSKLILVGDGRQADLRKNGLNDFMRIVERMDCHAGVEFGVHDVVRSGIVKEYLLTKEKYHNEI
jgi:phosphate starvation-inducible PhoH-like protein